MSKKKSISTLTSLIPNELWIEHVFPCNTTKDLLISICRVCKTWKELICDPNSRLCRLMFEKIFMSKFQLRKKKCDISRIPLIDLQKLLVRNDSVGRFRGEFPPARIDFLFFSHQPRLELVDEVDDSDVYHRHINCEVYLLIQKTDSDDVCLKKLEINGWTHCQDEIYDKESTVNAKLGEVVHIFNSKENSPMEGELRIQDSDKSFRKFRLGDRGCMEFEDGEKLSGISRMMYNSKEGNEDLIALRELMGFTEGVVNVYSFVNTIDMFVRTIERCKEMVTVKWKGFYNPLRLLSEKEYGKIDLESEDGLKKLEEILGN